VFDAGDFYSYADELGRYRMSAFPIGYLERRDQRLTISRIAQMVMLLIPATSLRERITVEESRYHDEDAGAE
jgi:hypothetical protein